MIVPWKLLSSFDNSRRFGNELVFAGTNLIDGGAGFHAQEFYAGRARGGAAGFRHRIGGGGGHEDGGGGVGGDGDVQSHKPAFALPFAADSSMNGIISGFNERQIARERGLDDNTGETRRARIALDAGEVVKEPFGALAGWFG